MSIGFRHLVVLASVCYMFFHVLNGIEKVRRKDVGWGKQYFHIWKRNNIFLESSSLPSPSVTMPCSNHPSLFVRISKASGFPTLNFPDGKISLWQMPWKTGLKSRISSTFLSNDNTHGISNVTILFSSPDLWRKFYKVSKNLDKDNRIMLTPCYTYNHTLPYLLGAQKSIVRMKISEILPLIFMDLYRRY